VKNVPEERTEDMAKMIEAKLDIGQALDYAYSEVQALADEIRETVDNASGTSRENTQRIQTLGETADTLEQYDETPEVPEDEEGLVDLSKRPVTFHEWRGGGKTGLTRQQRMDNAISALDAVIDDLTGWCSDERAALEEGGEPTEENIDNVSEGALALVKDMREKREELVSEVEDLFGTLEDAKGDWENVEFPGVRG
jgi:chromosome segregation ATPase